MFLHSILALASVTAVSASQPSGAAPTPARQIAGSISQADYPADAIAAQAQGTAELALDIGADGRVANCAVTRSVGYAGLDAATCRLIVQRFRFQPATRAGQPVAAQVKRRVTWQLPAPAAAPAATAQ